MAYIEKGNEKYASKWSERKLACEAMGRLPAEAVSSHKTVLSDVMNGDSDKDVKKAAKSVFDSLP